MPGSPPKWPRDYTKSLDGVVGAKLEDVDFAHVKIDAWAFPTFQTPDPGEKLPYRAKDFDWVAPYDPPTPPPADQD
ncbi:hypothetical protein AB0K16_46385 [Nonomuraea jabiensis]|uniref:hypothetical protein n=1 Tax=Nonomuraea jabiensis TaxID=882448 RepID=UPI003423E103